MNSPYGSFDHLNDGYWYDPPWRNVTSTDGDYAIDIDVFPTSSDDFAQVPATLQAQPWTTNTISAPIPTRLEQQLHQQHRQYNYHQPQQIWRVANTGVNQYWEAVPSADTSIQHYAHSLRIPHADRAIIPSPPSLDGLGITAADPCADPCNTALDQLSVTPERLRSLFPSPTLPRHEPPTLYDADGQPLQRLSPRFEGDLYQALWIRGEGASREGWCGHCPSWYKLKDSAYWYHLHYTHGIACSSGRPLQPPLKLRWTPSANVLEALCGSCERWVSIGKGLKMQTAYWRHAYKCMPKGIVKSLGRSPRKGSAMLDV